MNVALSAGAQVNAHDSFGDTALNLAAKNEHLVIVERLLEAGADIESLGGARPPLMNAAFDGHTRIVQVLLQQGARVSYDQLSSLTMKVNILGENAEAGMVDPAAAEAWRKFLAYMIEKWKEQHPQESQD